MDNQVNYLFPGIWATKPVFVRANHDIHSVSLTSSQKWRQLKQENPVHIGAIHTYALGFLDSLNAFFFRFSVVLIIRVGTWADTRLQRIGCFLPRSLPVVPWVLPAEPSPSETSQGGRPRLLVGKQMQQHLHQLTVTIGPAMMHDVFRGDQVFQMCLLPGPNPQLNPKQLLLSILSTMLLILELPAGLHFLYLCLNVFEVSQHIPQAWFGDICHEPKSNR